jgi:hypothetical protein
LENPSSFFSISPLLATPSQLPPHIESDDEKTDVADWLDDGDQVAGDQFPSSSVDSCSSSTMLSTALQLVDDPSSLLSTGPQYARTTIRHHGWVSRLFSLFCQKVGKEPYPMEPLVLRAFINFLGLQAKYGFHTVKDVVVSGLKRIHLLQFEKMMPPPCLEALQMGLHDLRSSRSIVTDKKGEPPLMYQDVISLLHSIPDVDYFKPTESLLYLFALYTGARAITCSNILVGDITLIDFIDDFVQMKVLLRVAKAKPNWNHTICFRDHKTNNNTDNIIFWFRLVLQQRFNLSLDHFSPTEDQKCSYLFPWSKGNLTQRLQSRLKHFGYDSNFFGFHSFRAGFACSVLTQRSDDKQGFLELSALVAGWIPSQPAQLGYIKDSTKSLIIANYLVQPNAPVAIDHHSSAHGYSKPLIPVPYGPHIAYKSLMQGLRYRLSSFSPLMRKDLLLEALQHLKSTFKSSQRNLPKKIDSISSHLDLTDLIESTLDQLSQTKNWYSRLLPTSRQRVVWTSSEDSILLAAVREGRSYSHICTLLSTDKKPHHLQKRYTKLVQPSSRSKQATSIPDHQKETETETQEEDREEQEKEEQKQEDKEEQNEQDEEEYEVERIIQKKGRRYLVKWLGYPQPTWEDEGNLTNCFDLLNEFKKRRKK